MMDEQFEHMCRQRIVELEKFIENFYLNVSAWEQTLSTQSFLLECERLLPRLKGSIYDNSKNQNK